MKLDDLVEIERKIVIGMIINTDFIKHADMIIDTKWVQSREARLLMSWTLDYFHKYKKCPGKDIQDIYMEKLRAKKVSKDQGIVIESILESLSSQSEDEVINLDYLKDQTGIYAKACKLNLYAEEVLDQLESGNVLEAEHLLIDYKPVEILESKAVTPLRDLKSIKSAFESFESPLLKYPGALGQLINQSLVKEGFVVFLGQSKGGKSWILMDAAIRAAKQSRNVLFFQAGDMSEAQMERRMAIHNSKKSDLKQYCGKIFIPTIDCIHNLTGHCELDQREGGPDSEAPFYGKDHKQISEMKYQELISIYHDVYDHIPCYNCLRNPKLRFNYKGAMWFKERGEVEPLTWKESYKMRNTKNGKFMDRIKLITYPSEGLTMSKIRMEWDLLEKQGFFPHICIIDYMDLLAPDNDTIHMKPRDQENKKWQRGRRLSQEKKALVISGSQSSAQGFKKFLLDKTDFSEDRRKLDHVTAMFGLNMTIEEKKKGIMRINDIVSRDTEGISFVHVLHKLQIGRPILGSFF